MRLGIVALALLSSSAGAQQLQDWEQPSRLDILNKSFAVVAHACAIDFGFTALAAPHLDEARDKLKAYLDLSGDGEAHERGWLTLMEHRNSLLGRDGSIAARASDALEAAVDDPSTYSQAEKLYVDTVTKGQRDVLADCTALADDPYIGKHYLAGVGRNRDSEDKLKKDFADSVKELTTYKTKVMPKRGLHK